MKKIKILRIISRLNIGGPAIHVVLLTAGLNDGGFISLLVCGSICRAEGDMSYSALEKGIQPHFIPELKRELNIFNDIVSLAKIYRIINTEKPDIIHTHTAKAGTLGRLAGAIFNFLNPRLKIKLIHTFHGHIFEGYFGKIKTKLFILIERFLARFTCRIITVSESVKRELVCLGICGEDKIEVIPLGFELDRFIGILSKNTPTVNIGIIGRLAPIKNHNLFLEAAAILAKENQETELRFKIVGGGELKPKLEQRARELNIGSQVDFLGWQVDLAGIYLDLDIVALTSINEGTPVSLIEAMASARAIVATDAGGVRDLLGEEMGAYEGINPDFRVCERGIIVKPNNPRAFSSALAFVLKDSSLREEMGLSGRKFAKGKFSKERLIKDTQALYARL